MNAPIPVRPGQIWADLHPYSKGRTVRVIDVFNGRALVEVVTMCEERFRDRYSSNTIGRRTRVSIDHRGLRGYRLVSEPDNTAGSAT